MKVCSKCVLPETYEGITFDEKGICNFCNDYKSEKNNNCFNSEEELIEALKKYRNSRSKYDVVVPLSGEVDSSNALIEIVEKYKLKPLAFSSK